MSERQRVSKEAPGVWTRSQVTWEMSRGWFVSRTARADDVTRKSTGVGQDKSRTAGDGQDLTRESGDGLEVTRS